MKIIRNTKEEHKSWRQHIVCCECHSEFEVEANDLIFHYYRGSSDMRGTDSSDEYFYVDCPVCDRRIRLNNDVIPRVVQMEAKKSTKAV